MTPQDLADMKHETLCVFRRGDEVLLGKWTGYGFCGPSPYSPQWYATVNALEQDGWRYAGPAPALPEAPRTAQEIAREALFAKSGDGARACLIAAIDAYELHLREPQPAPAPSGMTEAVRTLARVVEELVNQSGALTCGITALLERQRDIRSVYDALDKESANGK